MLEANWSAGDAANANDPPPEIAAYAPGVAPDPKVEALLVARKEARAKKDFAASDRIRDELAALGYAIKDMPHGKVEVRRN